MVEVYRHTHTHEQTNIQTLFPTSPTYITHTADNITAPTFTVKCVGDGETLRHHHIYHAVPRY